jgi:hypothetical protein
MKTIRFNTGRKYTVHGQRIVATLHDDGVVTFHDIDRMITGMLRDTVVTDVDFTQTWLMSEYDHGLYDNTNRAWTDGMVRGGINSKWEGVEA